MNFDLDDPLGSDDSFFEEPKALNRRASVTKKTDKKSFENLFNIGDTKNSADAAEVAPESIERTKNVTFEEPLIKETGNPNPIITDSSRKTQKKNDDWLFDSNPSSNPEKQTKKTDFLEDILSIRPSSSTNKKVTSFNDILKESKLNTASATSKSSELKETPAATETTSTFSLLSGTSKEKRRSGRGSSTAIEDTLGLFGDDHQSGDFYTKDKKGTPAAPFQSKTRNVPEKGVPDWLGGASTSASKMDTEVINKAEKDTKYRTQDETEHAETERNEDRVKDKSHTVDKIENTDVPIAAKQKQLTTELQNTYSSLQQQETFLLISLQLKKYEDNLEEVKRQQQEILEKQEKQYNSLLDKYVIKQQMIDNNIRLQQERINSHIQMLLSHTSTNNKVDNAEEEGEKINAINEYAKDFDNIIATLKQRHQEELFIIEESYKKQISLLEKSAETLEQTLSNEIINTSKIFEDKINNISTNYKEEILYYKQKINTIEEQHRNEITLLKEMHNQTLEELKKDHTAQIDYLKDLRQQENILLKGGNEYSQKLEANLEILNSNTKALQVVQDKLISNHDIISTARENSIEAREKEIILMRNALEKCREAAENERSQLLALVRSLETKIAEQNNNAREERWALQQASATLVARAAALDRESEYNRNVIEREREQLKTLKESLLAEQEKVVLQLTEEKLHLSAEKARIETTSRLTNNYESEKIKAEAETAIEVAKELTLKINQEREYLHRQKNEIEMLKRTLADRERDLNNKEMELEYLIQNAQKKINEDKRIINEARQLEIQYKERLHDLQSQWISLSNREKKLAEEKVLLSKERLALYTSMKQAKGCVLCKANDNGAYQAHDDVLLNRVSDPDGIRIRLEALEDEKNSEVSKEENNLFIPEIFS